MLKEYLESVFGSEYVTEMPVPEVSLPLLYTTYTYESFKIYEQQYIFVHWTDRLTLRQYIVRSENMESRFLLPVVLLLERTYAAQAKDLIDNRVSFVELGRQIYMPMQGFVLKKTRQTMYNDKVSRFSPQTQLCALYFIYSSTEVHTVKEIVEGTGLNKMAVSRGLRDLETVGGITYEEKGRTKYYRMVGNKKSFYNSIENYLINPIRREVMIREEDLSDKCVKSGFTALSEWSMLADSRTSTYAVSGEDFKALESKCMPDTNTLLFDWTYVKLQIWKYNPVAFSEPGIADKVSVWLSIPKPDERTEYVLDDLKEEILNGKT
ncbi:MAG: helix-turn-helix domain-containing protein [Clostridia bacterium]|nr:helix-turn-helix domain-containing protein [Clostridia bacterium]